MRRRLDAVGISHAEFAARAGLDRGTVKRFLEGDERIRHRTISRIQHALEELEDELGMGESSAPVTSTVEFMGARITMEGSPADVARAVREILGSPDAAGKSA